MQKLHIIMALILGVISVLITACSNADEPLQPSSPLEDSTSYVVTLNLGGEYISVSEEPLSRSGEEPNKYYGVNVYCMKTDGSETTYSKYAYGVFDNVAEMKITLLGGYKYKFECTSVTDDKDKLHYVTDEYFGNSREGLGKPFMMDGYNGGTYFKRSDYNKFIYDKWKQLIQIKVGNSLVKKSDDDDFGVEYEYPRLIRYYGEIEDFVPSGDASVTIPLKRTVFGIKVVANDVPDGKLEWYNNRLRFSYEECSGAENVNCTDIFTFPNVYDCWKSEEPCSLDFSISFNWVRGNGYTQSFKKDVTVKCNVMTVITVNLNGNSSDVGMSINEDQSPMTIEEVVVNYNGGDLNDTNVEVDPED